MEINNEEIMMQLYGENIKRKAEIQALRACLLAMVATIDKQTAVKLDQVFKDHYKDFLQEMFLKDPLSKTYLREQIEELIKDVPGVDLPEL